MSEGGHRKYDPLLLKRKYRSLGYNPAKSGRSRPKTRVETNDCRLEDGAPIAKAIAKAFDHTTGQAKREPQPEGLGQRKLVGVCRDLVRASPAGDWPLGKTNPYQWAVIGGAAFKLRGLRYSTKDVDVAAMYRLAEGTFPHDPGPVVNKNDNGHYRVRGVKVDWMYRLDDGSGPLFRAAIREASVVERDGLAIPVASVEHAMAIKVNAGRPQDVAVFYHFIEKGWVDPRTVLSLISKYVAVAKE